jgi:hypothetical protein
MPTVTVVWFRKALSSEDQSGRPDRADEVALVSQTVSQMADEPNTKSQRSLDYNDASANPAPSWKKLAETLEQQFVTSRSGAIIITPILSRLHCRYARK